VWLRETVGKSRPPRGEKGGKDSAKADSQGIAFVLLSCRLRLLDPFSDLVVTAMDGSSAATASAMPTEGRNVAALGGRLLILVFFVQQRFPETVSTKYFPFHLFGGLRLQRHDLAARAHPLERSTSRPILIMKDMGYSVGFFFGPPRRFFLLLALFSRDGTGKGQNFCGEKSLFEAGFALIRLLTAAGNVGV
jgi:hypothetical protein